MGEESLGNCDVPIGIFLFKYVHFFQNSHKWLNKLLYIHTME